MTFSERHIRDRSLWLDTLPGPLAPRPALQGDTDCDIAIVGAGMTGLWTAYCLLDADPSLRVRVIERQVAGFGASGRNGGWISAYEEILRAVMRDLRVYNTARRLHGGGTYAWPGLFAPLGAMAR